MTKQEMLTNFYLTGEQYNVRGLAIAMLDNTNYQIWLVPYSAFCEQLDKHESCINDRGDIAKMHWHGAHCSNLHTHAMCAWIVKHGEMLYAGKELSAGTEQEEKVAEILGGEMCGKQYDYADVRIGNTLVEVKGLRWNLKRAEI